MIFDVLLFMFTSLICSLLENGLNVLEGEEIIFFFEARNMLGM